MVRETPVCRSVLSLLKLQEASAREGEGFAAPGAGLVMLAANVTRTPDVRKPKTAMTDFALPAEHVADAEALFRREHPDYADTAVLDELRATDFARLDRDGHVYLDYTGGCMFASSVVAQHVELLESGDRFLLTFDNHNSVNGIREFARARGAETKYIPSVVPDLRVDESLLPRYLTDTIGEHHNLFAYPAQSNFSGVQHPLDWIEKAHAHGVGCLLARCDALEKLERPWFQAARSSRPSCSASTFTRLPALLILRTAPLTT